MVNNNIFLGKLISDYFQDNFVLNGKVYIIINGKKIDCTPYIYQLEDKIKTRKEPIISNNLVQFNLDKIKVVYNQAQNKNHKKLIHNLFTMIKYLDMKNNFLFNVTNKKKFNSSTLCKVIKISRPTLNDYFKRFKEDLDGLVINELKESKGIYISMELVRKGVKSSNEVKERGSTFKNVFIFDYENSHSLLNDICIDYYYFFFMKLLTLIENKLEVKCGKNVDIESYILKSCFDSNKSILDAFVDKKIILIENNKVYFNPYIIRKNKFVDSEFVRKFIVRGALLNAKKDFE